MVYQRIIDTPLPHGTQIGLRIVGQRLLALDYLPRDRSVEVDEHGTGDKIVAALEGYFSGRPVSDNEADFALQGSEFQQRVWDQLRGTQWGEQLSYGELARALGSSARAVAGACRANPIPLLIPCHRVVARGSIGGYMGHTEGWPVDIKEWLLRHESHL